MTSELYVRNHPARFWRLLLRPEPSPDEWAAMIDDRILHVGDQIDGFTVVAIDDRNGVVIERKDSP